MLSAVSACTVPTSAASLGERLAQQRFGLGEVALADEAGHPADPWRRPPRGDGRHAGHAAARGRRAAAVRLAPTRQGSRRRCPARHGVAPGPPVATTATNRPARRRDRAAPERSRRHSAAAAQTDWRRRTRSPDRLQPFSPSSASASARERSVRSRTTPPASEREQHGSGGHAAAMTASEFPQRDSRRCRGARGPGVLREAVADRPAAPRRRHSAGPARVAAPSSRSCPRRRAAAGEDARGSYRAPGRGRPDRRRAAVDVERRRGPHRRALADRHARSRRRTGRRVRTAAARTRSDTAAHRAL